MKKIYYYISLLTILLVTSCQQQEIVSEAPALKSGEYRFTVNIPEPRIATRAMGDMPATDLPLHVLVFDANGFFVANQTATVNSFDGTQGTYTVQLPPSDTERVLHFVLGNVEFGDYVPDDSEASIFSQLTVTNGTDAYWQRITVNNIQDGMTLPEVTLVRNFAKIVVSEELEQLEVLGYAIVRETTEGTVAPYAGTDEALGTKGGFATFNLPAEQEGTVYEQFTSLNPGFGGNNAGSVDETVPQEADFTNTPKYVYERNQDEASRPAFVLVRAQYNGGAYYYKLDLVETDQSTYITTYLNLYRNFQYTIRITSVSGVGYDTPQEAIDAVASNNIGASVEVSEVNTIQDGKNELYVSETDLLVVTSDVVTIDYEYREGIDEGEGTLANDKVQIFAVGGSGEDGLNPNAVASFTFSDGVLSIRPALLPALMEEQEFIVTTPSGLSRRILLRVHEPFRFRVVDCDDVVPRVTGSDVALTVLLPENMPTSAFPLTLDIEPERKSIYPDVTRNRIPVESEGNQTFSYQATVSYNDYRLNNGRFYFYFKTNMASSATMITVTNPYFLNENNTARFINTGDVRYGFIDVRLASEGNGDFSTVEDLFTFNTYVTGEKKITLSFTLHEQGDGYTPDGTHPLVEIYGDYMDWENAESSTGTFEVDPDGDGVQYTPTNAYGVQSITFTITEDLATGRFQLESYDHGTAIVEYTTPPCTVRFQYDNYRPQNVPRNATISLYSDRDYRNHVADYTVGNNGEITIRSFVGFELISTLYFRYSTGSGYWATNYDGEATVQSLISGTQTITLERGY